MYYSDLLQYTYKLSKPIPALLNVGWLDNVKNFSKGEVPSVFSEKLKSLIIGSAVFDAHFNRIRGIHPCGLCGEQHMTVISEGREEILGMSEVLVPSQQIGAYYASPSLIYHYVTEHNYLPPEEYINAVLAVDITQLYFAEDIFDDLLMNRSGLEQAL
jgi:hypothetical protein